MIQCAMCQRQFESGHDVVDYHGDHLCTVPHADGSDSCTAVQARLDDECRDSDAASYQLLRM